MPPKRFKHWLPIVEDDVVYHVTHKSNLPSIMKEGLIPMQAEAGETYKGVFVFPNYEDMDTALGQWLGDLIEERMEEFDLDNEWVALAISVEGIDWDKAVSDVEFEIAVLHTIDPKYITVLEDV